MGTILIVEDDNLILEALVSLFTENYATDRVLCARNGQVAARIIKQEQVDLVLTDLIMPDINGFDLLEYIQTTKPFLPVFVMTAHGHFEEQVREMGASMFFKKPLNSEEIIGAVNTVFELFGVDGPQPPKNSHKRMPVLRLIRGGKYHL